MRITPLDIRKQEFRKVMRGLDAEEVHAFLTTVADEYEAVLNDNKALQERLLELDDKVQEYRNMEKTLRNTLMTAERVNTEAKENARREAQLIVKEAEIEAEKTLRNIRNQQAALRQSIQELKRQKESYISRIRMVAEAHLKFIENAERDMQDDDHAVESLPDDRKPEQRQMTDTAEQLEQTPVQAAVEPPAPEEPPSLPAAEMDLPDIPAEEEASLFPNVTDTVRDERADEPAATGEGEEEPMPDLNEILERLGANRQESGVKETHTAPAPAERPAPPPASSVPAQDPALHSSVDGATERQAESKPSPERSSSAPQDNDGEEWSLERLKRDILSGTSGTHDNK